MTLHDDGSRCATCGHSRADHWEDSVADPGTRCMVPRCYCSEWKPSDDSQVDER